MIVEFSAKKLLDGFFIQDGDFSISRSQKIAGSNRFLCDCVLFVLEGVRHLKSILIILLSIVLISHSEYLYAVNAWAGSWMKISRADFDGVFDVLLRNRLPSEVLKHGRSHFPFIPLD